MQTVHSVKRGTEDVCCTITTLWNITAKSLKATNYHCIHVHGEYIYIFDHNGSIYL